MKMVTAIIRPSKIEDVRQSLALIGVEGMTVAEVRGYGRQKGQTEIYRGAEYEVNFLPKLRIDIAVDDSLWEQTVEVIRETANTGKIGAGKIFVTDLAAAMRIRTGETDSEAL